MAGFGLYKDKSERYSLSNSATTSQQLTLAPHFGLKQNKRTMKLTFALVLLSAMLLSVLGYPYPEPDTGRYPRSPQQVALPSRPGNFQQPPIKVDIPKPPPQHYPRGDIGANIGYMNRGLTGTVDGQATLWQSRNGRTDLGAQGHYSRTFSGPMRGQQDYGAGVSFKHRF